MEEGNDPNYQEKLKERQTKDLKQKGRLQFFKQAPKKTKVESQTQPTQLVEGEPEIKVETKAVVKTPVSSGTPEERKRKDYWDPPKKTVFKDVTGEWTTAGQKQQEIDARNRWKTLLPQWDNPDSDYWKFDSD